MAYEQPRSPRSNNTVLWIVLSVLGLAGCGCLIVVGGAVLFPVFTQARFAAIRTQALRNVKMDSIALLTYAADNNNQLPFGNGWMDAAEPYLKGEPGTLRSVALKRTNPDAYGIAFRKELSRKSSTTTPEADRWIMVFESSLLQRNASSGLETLPAKGRYGSDSTLSVPVGFLDGHAALLRDSYRSTLGKPGSRFR